MSINRCCKHYDFGRTCPRAYGAFCDKHKEPLHSNSCDNCKDVELEEFKRKNK